MKIQEVIVVEGKSDSQRLNSFFDVDTIETHGLGLKKETIEYIKEINDRRGVILLLDPDTPGEKIRLKLNESIPNLKNAFLNSDEARTKNKVGVEHASKEVIEKALENIITYSNNNNSLTYEDIYKLGLLGNNNSKELRDKVCRHFHIGKCNAKTLIKRLNMLNLSYNDIVEVLK